ncbi:4-vinyl reductase, partial [Salmonella sp. M9-3]|uniref:4-vinyl reductase n=1 Tax=Salmonella sp. M9-3 TaxID=3240318 RepID=UPI00352B2197
KGSFEAAEYKRRHGPGPRSVCHRLTGYLSGYASAFLGDDVLFIEHACGVREDGETACRIEGRVASEWGALGEPYAAL